MACIRLIQWRGIVQEITEREHVFRYSGSLPCTGYRKCFYCETPEKLTQERAAMGVEFIMAYENGELDDDAIIAGFQAGVDSGIV